MRSTIIVLITVIALIIPDFSVFLNLVGSICCGAVAFVLPPILYNLQFKASMSVSRTCLNYAVILFGVVGSTLSVIN